MVILYASKNWDIGFCQLQLSLILSTCNGDNLIHPQRMCALIYLYKRSLMVLVVTQTSHCWRTPREIYDAHSSKLGRCKCRHEVLRGLDPKKVALREICLAVRGSKLACLAVFPVLGRWHYLAADGRREVPMAMSRESISGCSCNSYWSIGASQTTWYADLRNYFLHILWFFSF